MKLTTATGAVRALVRVIRDLRRRPAAQLLDPRERPRADPADPM